MSDLDFDPELFGLWPKAPVYDGLRPSAYATDEALEAMASGLILETKAQGSALDDLQDMLNGMTRELREQMQQFRRLRQLADDRAAQADEEIDRKAIQADAKASIDAMSVIVRTLEKIDSLQRTIAHDRQIAAETAFDEKSYNAYIVEIDLRVERRAKELAARYIAGAGGGCGASGPDFGGARATDGSTQGAPRGSPEGRS